MKHKDQLPGGLADKKKPHQFPPDQIDKGVKVEMEHTNDPAKALEIAMDHLTEDRRYYDKLEVMEKKAFWKGFVGKYLKAKNREGFSVKTLRNTSLMKRLMK